MRRSLLFKNEQEKHKRILLLLLRCQRYREILIQSCLKTFVSKNRTDVINLDQDSLDAAC